MTEMVTAADVIARRRRPPVEAAGGRARTPFDWFRRRRDLGFAESTIVVLLQRAFTDGLQDADGHAVDPADTGVEAVCGEDGAVMVRLFAKGHMPIEIQNSQDGRLEISGADGDKVLITDWRNLPDVLPPFIRPKER